MQIALLIILLIASVVVSVAVLLQKSKDSGLSSTIVGGNDSFYGKDKASRKEGLLKKITIIAGIVFAVVVLVVYAIQPDYSEVLPFNNWKGSFDFL